MTTAQRIKVTFLTESMAEAPSPREGWATAAKQAHKDGQDKLMIDDVLEDETLPPYTLEELNARIAKSEQDAAEGRYMSHQEVFESINHFNTLLS